MYQVLRSDIRYTVCLFGKGISQILAILFSIYIVLWIASFVDSGLLESDEVSKEIYQKILLFSVVGTMFITPLAGYIADKFHWGLNICIAFTLRFITGVLFLQINDPRTIFATTLCTFYVISSILANISIEAGYLKKIPSEIRGTMLGLFWVFGFTGIVLFTVAAGYLHDVIGPKTPFNLLMGLDGTYLSIVVLMGLCGKLK